MSEQAGAGVSVGQSGWPGRGAGVQQTHGTRPQPVPEAPSGEVPWWGAARGRAGFVSLPLGPLGP